MFDIQPTVVAIPFHPPGLLMSVEIQWTDADPDTGAKRFVSAGRFAGVWTFAVRARRRENWETPAAVTADMWETLLDALDRRYRRREGVTDTDLRFVKERLAIARRREEADGSP